MTAYDDYSSDVNEAVRQLNSLLRGEISASETYELAMEKVTRSRSETAHSNLDLLRQMREDHAVAADMLRQRIRELGGEPSDSSGAWGAWARSVQHTADLFGDKTALKSLKEGEEHGLKDYHEARDDLDMDSRQLVEDQLIPTQERHINVLSQLLATAGRA